MNQLRFLQADSLRIGDLLMVQGARIPIQTITWRGNIVTVNGAHTYLDTETVPVSFPPVR